MFYMEQWKRNGRKEVVMVDLEALVPKEHLLRKMEKVKEYEWLYEHCPLPRSIFVTHC